MNPLLSGYAIAAGMRSVDLNPFSVLEHLDYLRSFLGIRLAWSRLRCMLCSVGAFNIWRRACGGSGRASRGSPAASGPAAHVLTEGLAPLFETLSLVALALAIWLGVVEWQLFLVVLGLMAFSTATLTSAAVLVDDRTARNHRVGSVLRMILVGPLDLFLYRTALMWARAYGTWGFLRGRRDWDKFARNARRKVAPPLPRTRGSTLSRG